MKQTLILFFVTLSIAAFGQQDCLDIPSGSWSGETSLTEGGNVSQPATVTYSNNQLTLSDFTGGLLAHFGLDDQSITLTINCNGDIESKETNNGSIGTMRVTGGSWNSSRQELTIDWEVPSNKISQTTTLTY